MPSTYRTLSILKPQDLKKSCRGRSPKTELWGTHCSDNGEMRRNQQKRLKEVASELGDKPEEYGILEAK